MRLLRLKTVLAATDLEPSSDSAVESAIRLADAAGAKLHLVYVSPDRPGVDSPSQETESAMTVFRERVGWSGDNRRVHVSTGDPGSTISRLSDEIKADVVVIGRHRQRADRKSSSPIGSTAYDVVTRALAPCLIASRSLEVPIQRALVAIDTSETARGALLVALSWASALRHSSSDASATTLTVLHIETPQPLSSHDADRKRIVDHELDVLKRGADPWAGVSVTAATKKSKDPVSGIIRFAKDQKPDLVVLGTRGLSEKNASGLGSVSSAVTNRVDMPVLLVPPAVWRQHARDIDYL
ncbi:MAG TPA: universal stress protein [Gemmatimonadaceae bacterium]|nr:universal stress protein [Gemmatimonadaceae bacterium]